MSPLSPRPTVSAPRNGVVTPRAVALGVVLCVGVAGLQCWISTVFNVPFFGGIQMPFGSVFVLMLLVAGVKASARLRKTRAWLSPTELLAIYSMLLFAALISTPGCDNFFLTQGVALTYFSSRENGWAALFERHVPSWFSPGGGDAHAPRAVVESFYNGGVPLAQIPWPAWAAMLCAWSVFLALIYGALFFVSLLLHRQWLVREALAFPLVQLPLQMVEIGGEASAPDARAFWSDRSMWLGFGGAAFVHFWKGMNSINADWPVFPVNNFGGVFLRLTERP